jgi:hypothetical protein
MQTKSKSKSAKSAQSKDRKLSNAELLRLAQKHVPPQEWYDEATNEKGGGSGNSSTGVPSFRWD